MIDFYNSPPTRIGVTNLAVNDIAQGFTNNTANYVHLNNSTDNYYPCDNTLYIPNCNDYIYTSDMNTTWITPSNDNDIVYTKYINSDIPLAFDYWKTLIDDKGIIIGSCFRVNVCSKKKKNIIIKFN